MSPDAEQVVLARYRAYLDTLAMIHLDPRLRPKFGWSDVIQQTWIEAYRDMARLERLDEPARRRRLYRMLVNNLREQIARVRAQCRDVGRERSLDAALDESTGRLSGWLAVEDDPGAAADAHARRVRVMEAVALLPDREREALVLQRYHGWKLREIAEHLGCTTGAVAGLHARALARLRELLPDLEGDR
jgi:RNA polymerase sigma-70 factor (ECF subfamily)